MLSIIPLRESFGLVLLWTADCQLLYDVFRRRETCAPCGKTKRKKTVEIHDMQQSKCRENESLRGANLNAKIL